MELPTFADLEAMEQVSAATLCAVLEEYATGGWSISPRVVINLINRVELTQNDKEALLASARRGFDNQNRRHETKAADEYAQVGRYLKRSM